MPGGPKAEAGVIKTGHGEGYRKGPAGITSAGSNSTSTGQLSARGDALMCEAVKRDLRE